MIFTAYRLEVFKMRKRLASWVAYLCFLALTMLIFGSQFYAARHSHGNFGLPDSLPAVLTEGAPIASVFGVALIVLMVCNEFDWKTSRQNIIDGLSKRQWFAGKVLLIPTIAVVLYLTQCAIGGTLAFIGTPNANRHSFDPTATYVLTICGVLLAMTLYSSIALCIALSVRSTGPVLGVALIYQVFDNIAARTLRGFRHEAIADWLPFQVHNALMVYNQYQPYGSSARSHVEGHWPIGLLFMAGAAWVAVMLGVSYKVYMKRDL